MVGDAIKGILVVACVLEQKTSAYLSLYSSIQKILSILLQGTLLVLFL